MDRTTGLSKGYGFVSFDNESAASTAQCAMDRFAIAHKRLMVQFKEHRSCRCTTPCDHPVHPSSKFSPSRSSVGSPGRSRSTSVGSGMGMQDMLLQPLEEQATDRR